MGYEAGNNANSQNSALNVAVGDFTGIGEETVAVGANALQNAHPAWTNNCVAIGSSAGNALGTTSGAFSNYNTAVGAHALEALPVGTRNTAIGSHSLTQANASSVIDNTAVGYQSLNQLSS